MSDNCKKCSKCRQLKKTSEFHKDRGASDGLFGICKECRKAYSKNVWAKKSIKTKMLESAQKRAKQRKLDFNIEITDIVIPDKCPVLKVKFKHNSIFCPTLDRIDNSKGYIKGNVCVISSKANRIKADATIKEIESIIAYMERRIK